MSLDADRTPVIVAVGQTESRDLSSGPLELAAAAARAALGAAPGLAAAIERLTVVNILAHGGSAPASHLATELGLRPLVARETTIIGGNTPQALVERAAGDIARGRLSATLILGAEALGWRRRLPAENVPEQTAPALQAPAPLVADPVLGAHRQDLSDEEHMAGLLIPVHVYPLFESVLAARAGRTPAEQREFVGRVMAPFTEVAARHPHAWFPQARSAGELATVTPENRLVVQPYVKTTVAFLGGAQAAALVVTSLNVARALGLDEGALFVWSAASANDVWFPMARPDLGHSAGLEAAAGATLSAAGVTVDEVSAFDVYSCFPSAVQIAAASLGLPLDVDHPEQIRRLTLTGGLPYFGGPGNNYTTHAIATMFENFRSGAGASRDDSRGRIGLVTSVGWYLTRHSVGIYGSREPAVGFSAEDSAKDTAKSQDAIDASALPCLTLGEAADAMATVVASTVYYDREGGPVGAPVIATLDDGRRVAASAGAEGLADVGDTWLVGARVHVEASAGGATGAHYRILDLP